MSTQQQSFLDDSAPDRRSHEYAVPATGQIVRCKSCSAQIVWAETPAGRAVPLALSTVQTRDGTQYAISHFRDCPDAKDWGQR